MSDTSELTQLLETLYIEKKEDFEQYRAMVLALPLAKKKEKGWCWHPFIVQKTGFTYGERAYIIGDRVANLNEPHRFRSGMPVNIFLKEEKETPKECGGVIKYIDKNKMKIVLNGKDVPQWMNRGLLGIDLMFDEKTYLEMEKALKKIIKAKGNRMAELRDIFLGNRQPQFQKISHHIEVPHLNKSQNTAINNILAAHDVAVVHGPPGTGKTTTLIQAIKLVCKQENGILVTAASNAAVDLMVDRLSNEGLNVVRIGNISRVDEKLIEHTLDGRLSAHPESKNIKKVKQQAAECRRKAGKYKRTFKHADRRERNELYREAGELSAWARDLESRLIDQIIASADVVACTLINTISSVLDEHKFHTVVIDEAAQAIEPATWIPLTRAHRVILAGDPFQLPPTVKSYKAAKLGYSKTLIEKGLERFNTVNFLNVQYRMNTLIMGFSNQQFYNNQLLADVAVEHWKLQLAADIPLVFIDTAGCGFEERVNPESGSKMNPDEWLILYEHLAKLLDQFHDEEQPSIGIISPYRAQVEHIKSEFPTFDKLEAVKDQVTISTIDGFQGQERDVMYISLVRSNAKGEIGFLSDYRRMNVAMTRAKKKLIVIGDSATIGGHDFYNDFLTYVEAHGAYETAWEYMS